METRSFSFSFGFFLCLCIFGVRSSEAADWVHWRGPEQTGVSREHDLPDRWSPNPKTENNNLIWKQPYGGRSTPMIMNGRVYFINSAGEGITGQERVMCFDAESGKVLWEYKFNVWLADIDILRVGWTNLAGDPETGNIFAAGTQGLLLCFDRDGKVLWRAPLDNYPSSNVITYSVGQTQYVAVVTGMRNFHIGDLARRYQVFRRAR